MSAWTLLGVLVAVGAALLFRLTASMREIHGSLLTTLLVPIPGVVCVWIASLDVSDWLKMLLVAGTASPPALAAKASWRHDVTTAQRRRDAEAAEIFGRVQEAEIRVLADKPVAATGQIRAVGALAAAFGSSRASRPTRPPISHR